jgi:Carboxypeptidase regulatory-like domain
MAHLLRNDGNGVAQWFPLRLVQVARGRSLLVASQFLLIGFMATLSLAQSKEDQSLVPSKSSLGQVSGHVYRSDTGEPIQKAQVTLLPANEDEHSANFNTEQRIVRTGVGGEFTISDLPAGDYHVFASHNGYSTFSGVQDRDNVADLEVSIKPGQAIESLVLHLYPAGVISGQVLDEDHDPVPRLRVLALRVRFVKGGQRSFQLAAQADTDDLGNYRLPDLSPGSYYVKAGGLITGSMVAVGLKEGPAGRVQYQDTYYPGVSASVEAQAVLVGPMAEAGDVRITVPTQKTFTVRGKLLPGAGPEQKGEKEVSWSSPDDVGFNFSFVRRSASVEPDGSFEIPGVPPGDYTLTATALSDDGHINDLGFASLHIADGNVSANVEIGHAAEIYGTVEAPPGASLLGERVSLYNFGPGFGLLHPSPELDSTGRFDIKNVPPGNFTFSVLNKNARSLESVYVKKAVCGGHDYATQEFTLTEDSRLDCDITLARDTSMVQGRVTSGDNAAPGVLVVIIPVSAELRKVPRYTLTAETDAVGQYKIAAVIPGDYLLFAVQKSSDQSYFDLGFADRNAAASVGVTIAASATQAVDLKLSAAK